MSTLFDALTERDLGMSRAADGAGSWYDAALDVFPSLPLPPTFLPETYRELIVQRIGEPPNSRNIFGVLTRELMRRGLIVRTGVRRKMIGAKSHARTTDEFRRG